VIKPVPAQIDANMPSLRKTVNAIALAVALITALAGPLGYGLVGYGNDSARASFRANLSANRVARYIYQNREMWQYQKSRLGDLLVLAEATDETGRHRITDHTGKLVLSEGDVAARFSLTRVAPIVVAEATVGFVAFTIPLDSLLQRVGLTALFSLLLSLGAYAAVRIFPLRVLDSALGALEAANRTILEKNAVLEQQNHALRQRERDLQSTEAALKHRSDQLVEAQQLGKIGDWSYRLGDANIWWAPEIYDLLGYDPDSFVCSHAAVMAIYQGDGVRRVLNSQADVMHTGQVQSVDVKGRRGDGTVGDFAVTSKAMTDPEGRLIGFNGTIQDISERKTAEESLQRLAYYDPLTGLANRALFHNEINDVLTRCARTGSRAALLLLDLDRFKEVNDSLGHAAGDELLCKVAHLLSRTLGKSHFLSRLGGDEFAVIMSDYADQSAVEALAAEVLAAISGSITLDWGEVNIGTSIGVVLIPRDGNNLNDLLRNADLALYRAKEDGRGRFNIFDAGMSAAAQHKMVLARELRRAVTANSGLSVHYQPQVELSTGHVTGFEALMRWNHPTFGNVPPSDFIPIAESSQLICDLGLWILREAAQQAKAWLDAGETPREVAVNVSAAQIWHTDFVSDVVRVLKETGLPPHLLCLELTESLLADHAEGRVRAVLTEFNRLGVTLALDDFGTDYSSLGYLTQLPFDKLKIDRIFIGGIAGSERARKLLEGVIALGRGLGMQIVMEGVENPEEVEILRGFNCDIIQGYVFARPTPAPQALGFARDLAAKSVALGMIGAASNGTPLVSLAAAG
jgi:diguanylate cyclase (GGDEF)-like protein/PAS domain S-box-containing protein